MACNDNDCEPATRQTAIVNNEPNEWHCDNQPSIARQPSNDRTDRPDRLTSVTARLLWQVMIDRTLLRILIPIIVIVNWKDVIVTNCIVLLLLLLLLTDTDHCCWGLLYWRMTEDCRLTVTDPVKLNDQLTGQWLPKRAIVDSYCGQWTDHAYWQQQWQLARRRLVIVWEEVDIVVDYYYYYWPYYYWL